MLPFQKIACGVDVRQLQTEVEMHPEFFGMYNHRKESEQSPHKGMTDIWVRYNNINNVDNPDFHEEHFPVWYPAYYHMPSIKEIVFKLMTHVQGEHLGGILITKLPAGGKIDKHSDRGWHADNYAKFFIPILNPKGAVFAFDDGVIEPDEGDVYWFDNSVPHWVENNADSDRIAMIVCIKTELFKNANVEPDSPDVRKLKYTYVYSEEHLCWLVCKRSASGLMQTLPEQFAVQRDAEKEADKLNDEG